MPNLCYFFWDTFHQVKIYGYFYVKCHTPDLYIFICYNCNDIQAPPAQVLSYYNEHRNYLGILIKCKFWFNRPGWEQRIYISNKIPSDVNATGPQNTLSSNTLATHLDFIDEKTKAHVRWIHSLIANLLVAETNKTQKSSVLFTVLCSL